MKLSKSQRDEINLERAKIKQAIDRLWDLINDDDFPPAYKKVITDIQTDLLDKSEKVSK